MFLCPVEFFFATFFFMWVCVCFCESWISHLDLLNSFSCASWLWQIRIEIGYEIRGRNILFFFVVAKIGNRKTEHFFFVSLGAGKCQLTPPKTNCVVTPKKAINGPHSLSFFLHSNVLLAHSITFARFKWMRMLEALITSKRLNDRFTLLFIFRKMQILWLRMNDKCLSANSISENSFIR